MKIRSLTGGHALLLLVLSGLFLTPRPAGAEALNVFVSILPQKYFVERIGGDLVHVSVMVPPGFSPATYEPKPKQMVNLTRSKIYFASGVAFETVWLERFAHASPSMTIVDTGKWIEKVPMKRRYQHGGGVDYSGEAIHAGTKDPHIWLSPPLVMVQARHIFDALVRVDPANRERYSAGYRDFIVELADLDLRISRLFQDAGSNRRFMVYHPAWGYFAQAYDLVQVPVQVEGKTPTPRGLSQLIRAARDLGMKTILVQPQFSTKSARTVADAIGGRVVFADPLALDWKKNLLLIAARIREALK